MSWLSICGDYKYRNSPLDLGIFNFISSTKDLQSIANGDRKGAFFQYRQNLHCKRIYIYEDDNSVYSERLRSYSLLRYKYKSSFCYTIFFILFQDVKII